MQYAWSLTFEPLAWYGDTVTHSPRAGCPSCYREGSQDEEWHCDAGGTQAWHSTQEGKAGEVKAASSWRMEPKDDRGQMRPKPPLHTTSDLHGNPAHSRAGDHSGVSGRKTWCFGYVSAGDYDFEKKKEGEHSFITHCWCARHQAKIQTHFPLPPQCWFGDVSLHDKEGFNK